VLAALPGGAKRVLRLTCRAGRDAVDGHARRLEVTHGHALLGAAAAARMPLLQELELSSNDDGKAAALAAGLRALAQGPASVTRAKLLMGGSASALDGLVSALACLTELTRLELSVTLHGTDGATQPLVLPWAHIEVGAAAARGPPARASCAWPCANDFCNSGD
jgi:hypothetical protein